METITRAIVNDYIEKIFNLLRKQKYSSLGVELTREERKKLFDFFYVYNEYGNDSEKFKDMWEYETSVDISSLNRQAFELADEELKRIIAKCGADPKNIFIIKNGFCNIDDNINYSMNNSGFLEIGDYFIESSYGHPINRDSKEITHYREKAQEEKNLRGKDGEASFIVYKNVNGKLEQIYMHADDIHFGGHISFKKTQIGGAFLSNAYSFDGKTGMMLKDVGLSKCINELMPFFYEFETLLSNNLYNPKALKKNKEE